MTEEFCLSVDELAEAGRIIRSAQPGTYTLPKLYGSEWVSKVSPTTFGARFRASVAKRELAGISLLQQKTGANHLQYLVHDR